MVSYWLLKEEPEHYSFDNLLQDGKTVWSGVRNNLALKYMRTMKKGDLTFYYHTGKETAVMGIIKIVSDSYPDPEEKDPKLVVVDVVPLEKLKKPVTLIDIKSNSKFKNFELVRIPRLSVMPVSKALWEEIIKMSKK
ncbi:MAG: putative RNA-binding protein with PUA-like domain [Candidatus Nitrosomirales archaeon]|jgi:predicted RNA-binding protein with PUA-like domain